MSDPHPTDVRVGGLVRERRMAMGMSQERLGSLLGVTYQQVQKYERGANRIGSSRLEALCRILGVPAGYFLSSAVGTGLAEAGAPFELYLAPGISPDSRALLVAFEGIADLEVRRRILELTQTLAAAAKRDVADP